MSIITPITSVASQMKRRTYRIVIEAPNGVTPAISAFRETIPLDAAGDQLGPSQPDVVAFQMQCSAASMAALPSQFQNLNTLLSQFGDWLETQQAVSK